jgi:hypothetical protein
MRRISADRGMTFGLKYQPRQVLDSGARDDAARDNEEEVIGTQLRFGVADRHAHWLAQSGGR